MQIVVKYNVGDKIKWMRGCFATTSHSGSCVEQILRVERIVIERGNSFNGWQPKFYYKCQDLKSGNFVTLDEEDINECSRKD